MDLLITHTDLDGISPIILYSLVCKNFDYKTIEINEVEETFTTLFKEDYKKYENIIITDLTLPESIYEMIEKLKLKNIKVFDHHETHLYANSYEFVNVSINLGERQTCGTELFFNYLKEKYPELNKKNIIEYVDLVRQLDTYNFIDDKAKELELIRTTIGKNEFIKSIIKRLKKNTESFEFTAFEKRFVKITKDQQLRYLQVQEKYLKKYLINDKKCGVIFASKYKSELGNYLSEKNPDLDIIIMIDPAKAISYRTNKDDVKVNDFASLYGGGGHQKASGSRFTDDMRDKIVKDYFNNAQIIDNDK